jgi:hypothetical protein
MASALEKRGWRADSVTETKSSFKDSGDNALGILLGSFMDASDLTTEVIKDLRQEPRSSPSF